MATRQQTLFSLMVVALAFATSSLTDLRFGGLPIGAPEIALIGLMIVHLPLGGELHVGATSHRFIVALALLFAAMLPGFFSTLISHGLLDDVMYNLIALTWVVVVFVYLQFGFDYRRGELEWLCGLMLAFSCIYFALCLALVVLAPELVFTTEDVLDIDLGSLRNEDMVARERLSGFADNPNQLGLHAIVALFFCLRFWRVVGTLKSAVALVVILAVGYLTGSDSFLLGAVLMLGMAALFGLLFSGSIFGVLLLLVPGVVGVLLLHRQILARLRTITSASGQDDTRFALWENGWLATLEKPLVGWGPGNWSGTNAPLEFTEAHNSVIDYVSSSGLIGAFVLAACLAVLFVAALRSRQATLLAGAASVLFYALFHNTLRQPLMWLAFFYISHHLWAGATAKSVQRRRRRRRASPSRAAV